MVSTYARFWSQVDRSGGVRACWPWTGMRSPRGVPVFEVRRKRTTARRYAYRLEHGDPGEACVVRPTCAGDGCVNPRHLTLSTPRLVAISNGSAAARNAAATACPAGHELVGDNVYRHPKSGRRECVRCRRGERLSRAASGV